MRLSSASVVFGLLSFTPALISAAAAEGTSPAPKRIADPHLTRQQAIKDEFMRSWNAYTKLASGFDMLSPIRPGGYDDDILGGFKGTVVESLSSMIVMGMGDSDEYRKMLEVVKKIDFTKTTKGNPVGVVSIFEMTIRYIGGLLSAYQLNGEKKEEYFLVEQAKTLADGLIAGWHGDNKVPFNWVNINTKQPNNLEDNANLAEVGTLTMEWAMLSKFTGDPKYAKLTQSAVDAITSTPGYFPSVWPTHFNPETLKPASTYITTGGGTDSFIEYLAKFPTVIDKPDHPYSKTYLQMMDSFQKNMVSKTGVNNLTFIADYNIDFKTKYNVGSHLACFIGGNIAYAGRLYKRDDLVQLGLEITESCFQTYRGTATGIGPYSIGWIDREGEAKGWGDLPAGRREFYDKNGFFVHVTRYTHHPEVIESLFYAHRITGSPEWRDMAWDAFTAIKKYADTKNAIAGVQNVNDLSTGLFDQVETYFYSATLKYLYLIFSDAKDYSLDEYVFTTEGHIFKRGSAVMPIVKSKRAASVAASTVTSTLSPTWGKVQEHPFNYKSIIGTVPGAGAFGAMKMSNAGVKPLSLMADVNAQTKKQGVFFAPPDADKKTIVQSTMGLLGISEADANSMLSRCPDNANVVPKDKVIV